MLTYASLIETSVGLINIALTEVKHGLNWNDCLMPSVSNDKLNQYNIHGPATAMQCSIGNKPDVWTRDTRYAW